VRGERVLSGNFFTHRVVRVWNELPEEVVEAGTITTFQRHLDWYMDGERFRGIWAQTQAKGTSSV